MSDWLSWFGDGLSSVKDYLGSLSAAQQLLLGVALFLITFLGSIAVTFWIVVQLPAAYFLDHELPAVAQRHPLLRWLALIGKNLLGIVLVILGIFLSLPGIPGQGILTILIGLMLLDFPGKRNLERKLVAQPRVRNSIDRIRARFGKPPLVLESTPHPPDAG